MTRAVSTPDAPAAIGPYSQAIIASGEVIYTSGQIGLDAARGEIVPGGIAAETERCLRNLAAVLSAAGSEMTEVVKTTVFLAEMADFQAMNEVYARFFPERPPARSTVAVRELPRGVRVEIEAVAIRGRAAASSGPHWAPALK